MSGSCENSFCLTHESLQPWDRNNWDIWDVNNLLRQKNLRSETHLKILIIGCAETFQEIELFTDVGIVTGCPKDSANISEAHQKQRREIFLFSPAEEDSQELFFPKGSFDVVICQDISYNPFVIWSLLTPGGWFFMEQSGESDEPDNERGFLKPLRRSAVHTPVDKAMQIEKEFRQVQPKFNLVEVSNYNWEEQNKILVIAQK